MALLGNEAVYEQITLRMARVLQRVAKRYSYPEIAAELNMVPRTIANYASRAETLTGAANQGELVRWWIENREDWARWWLADLEIDRSDAVV